MSRRLLTFSFLCVVVLLSATSAAAQAAMAEGNAQRSRVLSAASVDAPPKSVLWSSPRLFQIRETEYLTGQNGPFKLSGDFATGHYFTTPIITDGTLIVTAFVGNSYFFAIDAVTGKQLVTLQFERNEISAPAALGQLVFFGTQNGKVFAYDLTKRAPVWFYESKGSSFAYSEPAIDEGVVYICGSESGLFAFAAGTGELKWTFKSDKPLYRPAIKGDDLIVFSQTGLLIAFDKKTGTKKWEAKVGREHIGPAILNQMVFVAHVDGESARTLLRMAH